MNYTVRTALRHHLIYTDHLIKTVVRQFNKLTNQNLELT